MKLFCLPEYSILIGRYETTGLRSIFTLLSPMWTIHFTLVLIQFICVACLLVCKYINQKKVDLCTNSDWSLIYSGKKYCINLIGRFDATFFQSLTRLYCIPALISEATILLNWLETVLAKKYTPCQGVVWSQYRLSGTFYVPLIFGVVLFAKVCFFLPMQFIQCIIHKIVASSLC